MAKEGKTNALRMLDRAGVSYVPHMYECGEFTDGVHVAEMLGQDAAVTFKTIVTVAGSGKYYVFVLPVDKELDLKKCARAVGEKAAEPVHVKDINSITGYIRGGVSPIGMKKQFTTVIHESARDLGKMFVSGGRLGLQLEISPADLAKVCAGTFADIVQ